MDRDPAQSRMPLDAKISLAIVVTFFIAFNFCILIFRMNESLYTSNILVAYFAVLGAFEIDTSFIISPPRRFSVFKNHAVARWFRNGLVFLSLLMFIAYPFFSIAEWIGFLMLSLLLPMFFLVNYSSYSIKLVKESGGIEPSRKLKHVVNRMVAFLPLIVWIFYIDLEMFVYSLSIIYSQEILVSITNFLLFQGAWASVLVIGLAFYAFFIDLPYWVGRRRWKERALNRLCRKRLTLLGRIDRLKSPTGSSTRLVVKKLSQKADLGLAFTVNERTIDEVSNAQSHPYSAALTIVYNILLVIFYAALAYFLQPLLRLFVA